jgi:hypothetical protein
MAPEPSRPITIEQRSRIKQLRKIAGLVQWPHDAGCDRGRGKVGRGKRDREEKGTLTWIDIDCGKVGCPL